MPILTPKEFSQLEEVVFSKCDFTGQLTCDYPLMNLDGKDHELISHLRYSVLARVEYQVLMSADIMGERVVSYFSLKPTPIGQGGIDINWEKASTLVYIPRFMRERMRFEEPGYSRDIFSQDEWHAGAIVGFTHPLLTKKVLDITPEEKIKKLATDSKWRGLAKSFTRVVVRKCRKSVDNSDMINPDYPLTPVVKRLLEMYMIEMNIKCKYFG